MVKSVNEILENALQYVQGKEIIIVQEGFIESKFNIKNAKCGIELDVLSIEGEKNYIRINLNQVSNVEKGENEIKLFLDNDTIIKINY